MDAPSGTPTQDQVPPPGEGIVFETRIGPFVAAGPYYPDTPEWAKVSHLYTACASPRGWTSAALATLS